jgi:hypothetical protein
MASLCKPLPTWYQVYNFSAKVGTWTANSTRNYAATVDQTGPPHRPALHIQAARPPSPPQPAHRNSPLRPSPVRSCPWSTEYPHATCSHPATPAAHSRPRLHLANACIACIAFFPISHLPGSSLPLSHYPTIPLSASMLQADNVNNRRRQRQRKRPSVQRPLSTCLPLHPSYLYTTTAELDTTKPALFIPLCMTSTRSHP